ncbi:23S rRNA (guanosine(2251)-2'-O)-methyltransferase RlmB [Rubrobacter taiwanensis]|uniref:23S rRNA (Guanosine(2251)-2'-O)-methyltransferase RlmB n=1 Tax=Rubrobacter taiwanensis TaxID=185139 RepID=A0A4R1BGC3_9ACTN|nr:23S rRNA (guanosine(2251)-2'-O)-methyltransferase RlmB [Rubrobacter taiwanensis]TCJ16240.1 23S rRNA (guanosine(2251)-2'-O)-methyltransferase RlmB [Rubrobacter taiwanensis]
MKGELLYGLRPVLELLRSGRREVLEVLDASGSEEIEQAAAERGAPVRRISRKRAAELVPGSVHQGVLARAGPYPYAELEEILSDGVPLLLVLDGVTDPQNLGGVLRVADAAGASGVVIPKDRAAPVTPAAVKASAGASEYVRVARETNLRRALEHVKEAGVWVYAAESRGGTPYVELDLAGPVALALGSEGRGLRRLVREACDGMVSIPMCGTVDSLNVSVAAAVLAFEARRQRGWRRT